MSIAYILNPDCFDCRFEEETIEVLIAFVDRFAKLFPGGCWARVFRVWQTPPHARILEWYPDLCADQLRRAFEIKLPRLVWPQYHKFIQWLFKAV